jgi:hypothetical protein
VKGQQIQRTICVAGSDGPLPRQQELHLAAARANSRATMLRAQFGPSMTNDLVRFFSAASTISG